MKPARLAGMALLGALALLFALRVAWIGLHLDALKPVGGGVAAPPFTLPLLRGGEVHVGGAGPVTLIDFWATWCGPCREELPRVDALSRRYRDRGVRIVAVDVEPAESKPLAEKLAGELRLELPIALGGDEVAEQYKVTNLPHVVVVDRSGRVGRVLLGMHSEDELARLIENALE